MKIGQPFFKLNSSFILSTFEEHQFDVVFIIGIEATPDNRVIIACNSVKSTLAEVHKKNKYVIYHQDLFLDKDANDFMRLTDPEQNDLFRDELGYHANPEDLRESHKVLALDQITNERAHLQQQMDRLDYIENDIENGDDPVFTAGKKNDANLYVGDTFEFESFLNGTDVTSDTTFYVNSMHLGPVRTNTYIPEEPGSYIGSATHHYNSVYFNFEVLPTP